jgi:hypothetical protein
MKVVARPSDVEECLQRNESVRNGKHGTGSVSSRAVWHSQCVPADGAQIEPVITWDVYSYVPGAQGSDPLFNILTHITL